MIHYIPNKRLNFVSARRHFSFIRPSVTVNTLLLPSHTDYCFNYIDTLRNWLTEKWCFENPRDNTKYYISVINLKSDTQCVAKSTVERSCTICSFAKFCKLLQPTEVCDDTTSSWRSCPHTVQFSLRPHSKQTHNFLQWSKQQTRTELIGSPGKWSQGTGETKLNDGNIITDIMELDMTNGTGSSDLHPRPAESPGDSHVVPTDCVAHVIPTPTGCERHATLVGHRH